MLLQVLLSKYLTFCTADENIIGAPKMRNKFCYSIKMVIFPICDSNIGLFSFTPN